MASLLALTLGLVTASAQLFAEPTNWLLLWQQGDFATIPLNSTEHSCWGSFLHHLPFL